KTCGIGIVSRRIPATVASPCFFRSVIISPFYHRLLSPINPLVAYWCGVAAVDQVGTIRIQVSSLIAHEPKHLRSADFLRARGAVNLLGRFTKQSFPQSDPQRLHTVR